jgi:type IV pilus assembly protein PilV
MGILAMVGLQAVSINTVSEAKYRTDAAFLASRIIGEMWVGDRNAINTFAYPGGNAPGLAAWVGEVQGTLPDAVTYGPQIVVAGNAANGYTVQVTVSWKSPGAAEPSGHTEVAFIRNP